MNSAGHPEGEDANPAPRSVPPPRNYLEPAARRQIFWRFMPPALLVLLALGWIERTWFPRGGPPPAKQVDTRLEVVRGERPAGDAVLIEPEADSFTADMRDLAAGPEELAKIRDDAFFRSEEEPAWIQTWLTLRSGDVKALRAAAVPVSFTELFGQPLSFRGRPVRFAGALRRLERLKAPANDFDIGEYWQGWLEPAAGPASPIVIHFLRIPDGMPTGLKIDEQVEVSGYFFKRYAYKATDTIRRAPLVLAIEPDWKPRPRVESGGTSLGTVALVTMAGLVAMTLLARALGGRRRRAAAAGPTNLDEALAGEDIVSTGESLRRLAAQEQDPAAEEFDR